MLDQLRELNVFLTNTSAILAQLITVRTNSFFSANNNSFSCCKACIRLLICNSSVLNKRTSTRSCIDSCFNLLFCFSVSSNLFSSLPSKNDCDLMVRLLVSMICTNSSSLSFSACTVWTNKESNIGRDDENASQRAVSKGSKKCNERIETAQDLHSR